MKRFCWGLISAAVGLLLIPLSAGAAEYETFVACDYTGETYVPSHVCHTGDSPAAFFSSDVATEFEVCVEWPGDEPVCGESSAEAGVLYYLPIKADQLGEYFVTWNVGGPQVGSWSFVMEDPLPPPPPPVTPVTPAVTAPVASPPPVVTLPSAACLKAKKRVQALKARLKKADEAKVKAKIRFKLKQTRYVVKQIC